MSAEKIQRAVERLRETGVYLWVTADDHHTFTKADIRKPLAALIEAAAKPDVRKPDMPDLLFCRICGQRQVRAFPLQHAPDCALMALVDAVLGEGG